MKANKVIRTVRGFLIAAFAAFFIAGILFLIPFAPSGAQLAEALTATTATVSPEMMKMFGDYTLTTLNEDYDTLEELEAYRSTLGQNASYERYFERAEDIICGKVRYDGMREFSTKDDAQNPIEQYGNRGTYQTQTLKWAFMGNVSQVTGIYGVSDRIFNVYVEASSGAQLPWLVFAQHKGYFNSWRQTVKLSEGINTITFPFGTNTKGEKGGVVYIYNPYTQDDQRGEVSLYIEGGGFYPVFRCGDDEEAFIGQVEEFNRQRQLDPAIPDVAELLPDHALLTINFSSVYKAYVTNHISPSKNLEYWSNYFNQTFEFNGIATTPQSPYGHYDERNDYARINIRRMSPYPDAGAYTYDYHIGIFSGEDDWLADYTNDTVGEYERFACLGHEIGHMLDISARKLVETTNNVNAVNAFFRILGNSMNGSIYLPFNKAQRHMFSDYTLDDLAFDDGAIIYRGNNYDHNYMMWWCLESAFPGYWGKLNNLYRYDASASTLYDSNEKMVYYSSLVTGVDLSEYFERWGLFFNNSTKAKFKIKQASATFNKFMQDAREEGLIDDDPHACYWFADAKEIDFMLEHASVPDSERGYIGRPAILSVKRSGSGYKLEIGTHTEAEPNLLGYEIYSKVDGEEDYKLAGFTYSSKFTDEHAYPSEPTYMVRGVNRFFRESEFSETVTGAIDESAAADVCKVGDTPYKSLEAAYQAVRTSGGTIKLLTDCSVAGISPYAGTVTITVDESVERDITITNSGAVYMFGTSSTSVTLILQGRANAKIILDGQSNTYALPAIHATDGTFRAEYVEFRNYASNSSNKTGGAILAEDAALSLTHCVFAGCSSNTEFGVIAAGNKTSVITDCTFENNYVGKEDKYRAAIGLASAGKGSVELDNCTFIDNEGADIYVNGAFKFKTHIPAAVVDFSDYTTVELENCAQAEEEIEHLVLKNPGYGAKLKDDKTLEFAKLAFTLTFRSETDSIEQSYTLLGTAEFTFGSEQLELPSERYVSRYFDEQLNPYSVGDTITLRSDMSFTLKLKDYLKLTLKYLGANGATERTVLLKEEHGFYLPRLDEGNREIVGWVGSESYWAGSTYFTEQDDTLYAVYPNLFRYTFVCHDEVEEFGYAAYDAPLTLKTPSVDGDSFSFWRTATQLFKPNEVYSLKGDVVFIAVYLGGDETYYDLTESDIELEYELCDYDGQAQMPTVTVRYDGKIVPDSYYTAHYIDNVNAGPATVTIQANGYYAWGSKSATFRIAPVAYSDGEFGIEGWVNEFVYSGSQTSQSPVIRWKGTLLADGKDYSLAYTGDRTRVGTVQVAITFKGNFAGEETRSYAVVKATRTAFAVSLAGWIYGQAEKSPTVSGYGSEQGKVVYSYAASQNGPFEPDVPKNAGTYWVKAEMEETASYHAASSTAKFIISQATLTDVPKDFAVDSRMKTLKDVAQHLPQGWSWEDDERQLSVGKNQASALYEDLDNYTNSRVQVSITVTEFSVLIEQAEVTVLEACVYNGAPQTPAVSVVLNGEVLENGTDYTLAYSDNTNAGTAKVTVTGKGTYTGSRDVSFTIAQLDIGSRIELAVDGAELVDGVYKLAYDGESHTVSAEIGGLEGVTVRLDQTSVKEVGEYRVTAEVVAGNYCGVKEFTVVVYADDTPSEGNGNDTVAVAVGVTSGVVGAGAIGGIAFWFIRRRRRS